MLDTRLLPNNGPSFNRKSPEGLSITRVGAEGVDGEVKAYWEAEAWTLMSLNGSKPAIVACGLGADVSSTL